MPNLKRAVLVSLILHITAFSLFGVNFKKDKEPEMIEINLNEGRPSVKFGDLPLKILEKGEDMKTKNGFYGIGVSTTDYTVDGQYICEITRIHDQYPASRSGLVVGDKIIKIDGEPVNYHCVSIRDVSARVVRLTVLRKDGSIVEFSIMREFIPVED